MYDPLTSSWLAPDPLAHKYTSLSPYVYCAANPVNFVDPDGKDWYSYTTKDDSETKYAWTAATSQAELANLGITGTYLGKAVVVFKGYYDESLSVDGKLIGEGAKAANVIVYGPNGESDIQNYVGYTMSSDPTLFGVVDNGIYAINKTNQPGPFGSQWSVNNRGKVPALNGFNPAYPNRDPGYLDGVFIHRNNNNGFSGTFYSKQKKRVAGISEGCLIISSNDWDSFNKQLLSVYELNMVILRH